MLSHTSPNVFESRRVQMDPKSPDVPRELRNAADCVRRAAGQRSHGFLEVLRLRGEGDALVEVELEALDEHEIPEELLLLALDLLDQRPLLHLVLGDVKCELLVFPLVPRRQKRNVKGCRRALI